MDPNSTLNDQPADYNTQLYNPPSSPELFNTNLTNHSLSSTEIYHMFLVTGNVAMAISLLGFISNLVNAVVLTTWLCNSRLPPTYHLLLALTCSDMLSLMFYGVYASTMFTRKTPLLWQELSDSHSDFEHVLMRGWYFPINICLIASNWIILAVTFFRFLAVSFPVKVSSWCTSRRVGITIAVIFLLSILFNLPDWLTVKFYRREDGRIRGNDTNLYLTMPEYYSVYTIVETIVPVCADSILVCLLIRNLYKNREKMSGSLEGHHLRSRQREHKRISIMLISLDLWFLCCKLPQLVYILIRDHGGEGRLHTEGKKSYQTFQVAANLIMLINHAGNVILYCLVNRTYRVNFMRTIMCQTREYKSSRYSSNTGTGTTQKSSSKEIKAVQLQLLGTQSKDNL